MCGASVVSVILRRRNKLVSLLLGKLVRIVCIEELKRKVNTQDAGSRTTAPHAAPFLDIR
jgi:hypothetical protein